MEILIRRHGLNAIKYLFLVIVICDLYSSVVASQSSKSDGNSVEEQEYGVRYADDCEGKL